MAYVSHDWSVMIGWFVSSFTDVGGVAVGAIDLIYCSLSVPRFVSVFDVSQ